MTTDQHPTPAPGITLQEIAAPILAKWKRILLWSFIVAVITFVINWFVLPLTYKSSATLLPDTDKGKMGALGQLSGLASLAGVSVGSGDAAKLYPTIIASESVLRNVIEKHYVTRRFPKPVTLIEYFELNDKDTLKNFEDAMKTMNGILSVGLDNKTSVISLSVEMREPQLAADVLNEIIAQLDMFMRSKKISNASEQRKWIDDRLEQVKDELSRSENTLRDFREKNQQVRSPQLLLEQERLLRDVQVKSTIFIELKKQSELAKIEEIKNISIVNVLDEARPPAMKERPKRGTNTVLMFMLAFMGLSGYEVVRTLYGGRIREYVASFKRRGVGSRE